MQELMNWKKKVTEPFNIAIIFFYNMEIVNDKSFQSLVGRRGRLLH